MQFADPSLDLMGVAKMVLDRWIALTDPERHVYEKRAEAAKQRQEAELQKWTAAAEVDKDKPDTNDCVTGHFACTGAELEQGLAMEKENQTPKDAEPEQVTPAKRKRTPTAYALFAIDDAQRRKAAQQCQAAGAETGAKHIAVALREMWKAMSDLEKAPYEELRERARNIVVEAPATKSEAADVTDADSMESAEQVATVTPSKATTKKRAREGCPGESATKRGRAAGKPLQAAYPEIEEEVLEEARSLGLERSLKNLAARSEVQSKGSSAQEMLHALRMAEGLVNKAKQLLLGA